MLSWLSDILLGGVILLSLVGSIFTVKGNIQDVTKVTGTITNQKHNIKQSQSLLIFVKI